MASGLTIVSANLVGGGGLEVIPLCAESNPNNPGDNEFSISTQGNQLVLSVKTVGDTRCSGQSIDPREVEVVFSNGQDTFTVTFFFDNPPINNQSNLPIVISDFENTDYIITVAAEVEVTGVLGGIGPNVEFEIKYRSVQSNMGQPTMVPLPNLATESKRSEFTSLKSGEVYRMFLEFQSVNGRFLFPKWIADIKIPEIGTYESKAPVDGDNVINYCYVETKLLNVPNDPRIKGWRVSMVERTEGDKSVVTQGIFNPDIEDGFLPNVDGMPSYLQRTVRNSPQLPTNVDGFIKPQRFNTLATEEILLSTQRGEPASSEREITSARQNYTISIRRGSVYTPETIAERRLVMQSGRMRKLGLVKNTFSESYREVYDNNNQLVNQLSEFPGETSLTRFTVQPGANILASLITQNTDARIKMGKLISDNHNVANQQVFSQRKHAFVRHFGGITYERKNFDFTNNMSVDGRISYTPAIENIFNLNQPGASGGVTYRKLGRGTIGIMYENSILTGRPYNFFGASSISLTETDFVRMFDYPELPPDDPDDYGVLVEFYRVVQNQYGGDTYNARQLNRTIPYSNIVELQPNSVTTEHQGDTFIQKFNFLKTFRSGSGHVQIAEIVSVPVETTINLDLRYDILRNRGNNFDAEENTSYGFNRVYEQLNNTIRGVVKPFNFTEITEFPVNVIPSKVKFPGELIDSFTDFLVNDVITLDGQYGEITGLGEHNDQVFSFQREGVAYLAINPRVQLAGSDGIQIELGSGKLIERYQYLSTSSGTLNKWSIMKTRNGLMYFDLLNKSLNFLVDQELSTIGGIFNKIKNFVEANKTILEEDDILAGKGVHTFYDNNTEDVYFTFLANQNKFTVSYNGLVQGFVSYYDFHPTNYFKHRNRMLSTIDNKSLWKHGEGDYQTFYGVYYPASVTVLCNPEPYTNKIFNNLSFQAETYLDQVDQHNITFNKIRVWNEFQDTGVVDLVPQIRPSLKRKFRNWHSIIPRAQNSRDRINNAWAFIELELDRPEENYEIVLHDLILSYL